MSELRELLDSDGENRAVRCFLSMLQGGGDTSVKAMKIHMEHSGFNGFWPDWVTDPKNAGHLTKGGAQDWLRHLFSLEASASPVQAEPVGYFEKKSSYGPYVEVAYENEDSIPLYAHPPSGKDAGDEIKAAFFEGFNSYATPCVSYISVEKAWGESDTKEALDAAKSAEGSRG